MSTADASNTSHTMPVGRDPSSLNCFVPHAAVKVQGAPEGPLHGLTFAAKDLYDVAGFVTGAGNPSWRKTHAHPADSTATPVLQVLDAGADLVGKTITDDLACGMFGENIHYGTPLNPAFPGRVPGGSSSGSVSAVAGGVVDFALGTDTGGSIRVPASFCGIYGIRPSHGRIPLVGCVPMAPAFDTCGWFARDAAMLERVGDVLLPQEMDRPITDLAFAQDAVQYANRDVADAFRALMPGLGVGCAVNLFKTSAQDYVDTFWPLMSRQLWNSNGRWFERADPELAPGLAERFVDAKTYTGQAYTQAEGKRAQITSYLARLLDDDLVVLLPTTHDVPPRLATPPGELAAYRQRNLGLITIASLGRLPQVTIPAMRVGDAMVGLSLIGRFGSDRRLLKLAGELAQKLGLD